MTYKEQVASVLQKQRKGVELTDEELDILFEQLSPEAAKEIDNQHTPVKK